MKINLIIGLNPYFQSSASTNRWLTLLEGLHQLGTKIELLIYGGYQSEGESRDWATRGHLNGIAIKYIQPQLLQGYWKTRYQLYLGAQIKERRLLNLMLKELQYKEGVIWTDSSHFGFKLAVHLKKQQPTIQLFLELSEFLDIHQYNKGNFLQRWQANKRQQFFEKTAFHVYDGLALMTRTLFNHYQHFPEPKPKLLHLPMTVDLDRFADQLKPLPEFEQPYIAFVGVMNDVKDGVSILIKAFAQIAHKFPKLKLYLIGGWNYDTPIHTQLIKENRMEDKIFWKGEMHRDQIPAIIKNATLLALPRPDSKQAQGGFPTKLGEYLATGNPVCATTVGEIPDYLKDGESVFFAQPGSVDSFAEAMRNALIDKENATTIGIRGKEIAIKHFNKDIQSEDLYNFLIKLSS